MDSSFDELRHAWKCLLSARRNGGDFDHTTPARARRARRWAGRLWDSPAYVFTRPNCHAVHAIRSLWTTIAAAMGRGQHGRRGIRTRRTHDESVGQAALCAENDEAKARHKQ